MVSAEPLSAVRQSPFVPFVPLVLAGWTPAPGGHRSLEGTLVFADISGFTALSERLAELGKAGAEELTTVLTGVFAELLHHAESLGGDLLSFGGDALLLLFTGDDHPARGARAAAIMRARLKARGPVTTGRGRIRLRISMGIHSGELLLVSAGTTQRELLVIGAAATEVTDMESTADAGEIVCSPSTAAALPRTSRGARRGGGVLLARMPVVTHDPQPAPVPSASLGPYLPAAVRRLVEAGIDEPEHRYVGVGFVHLGGVDRLIAEQGVAAAVTALSGIVDAATLAADAAGITVVASDVAADGAKLILTSGAPSTREDGEARLLVAARSLASTDSPLEVRIGVHAGHVFAGTVGAPWRRVYTVMGDAVNLAARLMGKARPGEVVASASIVQASSTPFELTALDPFMVKGKRRPQEAYVVGPQIQGGTESIGDDAPFVGRSAELDQLKAVFDRALEGRGGCVELVGEAGMGKSRLLDEVVARVDGMRLVRVTCDPFQRDRAYFASRLALRAVLGIPVQAGADEAGASLAQVVEAADPSLLQWLPLIARTVNANVDPTSAVEEMDPSHRPRILREVVDQLLVRVVTSPTAFVFDDAGRMDDASADVFARLAVGTADRPWVLCTTSRGFSTGLHPGLGYEAETIELTALTPTEQHQLATVAGEAARLSDHALAELTARAEGNPLYLLELVHARSSTGDESDIPASLEGLVAARIDGLDPVDRRILRYASVLGTRFPQDLFRQSVADLAPVEDVGVWRRLGRFIQVDGADIRFRHDLVREVAYDSLPFSVRRDLHGRVAAAVAGSAVHISDALMALHYDRAGDHRPAWRHARAAGARAASGYANAEAASQYERAVRNGLLAEVGDDELAEVAEAMGDASQLAGQFERAARAYRLARARRDEDDAAMVRLLRKEGMVRDRTGRYEAAVRWFRRARRSANRSHDPVVLDESAEILVYLAGTKYRQGQFAACIRWSERALEAAAAAGNRRAEAHACYLLDNVYTDLGRPEAQQYRYRALPIFEELNDFVGQGNVLNNLGATAVADGRWNEAVEFYERSRMVQQRAGDVVGMANSLHNLGELRSDQGHLAEAEELLREARRIWRAADFTLGVACASSGLGRVMGRTGRIGEAEVLLTEAEVAFDSLGVGAWSREAVARRADALVLAGRIDDACQLSGDDVDSGHGDEPSTAMLLRVRGLGSAFDGDFDDAAMWFRRSIDVARSSRSVFETAVGMAELARLPGVDEREREALLVDIDAVVHQLGADLTTSLADVPWATNA